MLPFDDRSHRFLDVPTNIPNQPAPLTEPLSAENHPAVSQDGGMELSNNQCDVPEKSSRQLTLFSPPLPARQMPPTTGLLSGPLDQKTGAVQPRSPMVIKGGMKKLAPVPPPRAPHKKHRLLVSLLGVSMLLIIICLTFFSASPLGQELGFGFNPLQVGSNLIRNANDGSSLIAQATATAIYYRHNDGYDPSSHNGQYVTNGAGSLNWPLGQCTYWANYEYHLMTGYWVSWTGNANQWVAGAQTAGWQVSTTPRVPSIIVLMPYVQGAGGYGHVAVVVSIIANSNPVTVLTSNMNWYAGGGGWNKVSYANFTVGPGVYFVWRS